MNVIQAKKKFGQTIRFHRRKKDFSQKTIATLCQCCESLPSEWERGQKIPCTWVFLNLIELLGQDFLKEIRLIFQQTAQKNTPRRQRRVNKHD